MKEEKNEESLKQEKSNFGTKEWAEQNINIINGCSNNCIYCYARAMAIRYNRLDHDWKDEKIRAKVLVKNFRKRKGRIMFPSTHDIHPSHLTESLIVLGKILNAGNEVLIVTKPHLECVTAMCSEFEQYKDKILFRFTIGSNNSNTLKFWEPNAPSFEERLECLKYAWDNGFQTSVSSEPILDTNTQELVDELLPYITDAVWVGKPNMLKSRLKMNGYHDDETIKRVEELNESLSDAWIKDLYEKNMNNPKIKWKESIKKIVGIEISTVKGLDQ